LLKDIKETVAEALRSSTGNVKRQKLCRLQYSEVFYSSSAQGVLCEEAALVKKRNPKPGIIVAEAVVAVVLFGGDVGVGTGSSNKLRK